MEPTAIISVLSYDQLFSPAQYHIRLLFKLQNVF